MAKSKGKSTALATRSASSGSLSVPSYIKEGREGAENIKLSEVKVPILKIAQPTTPEVSQGKVPLGHFFNSVTREDFGLEVEVIFCLRAAARQMASPYKPGKPMEILCTAPDGLKAQEAKGKNKAGKPTDKCSECVHSLWKEGKEGQERPACNEQGRYVAIVPGSDLPLRLFLQSNGFQAHKAIGTSLIVSKYPIYGHKFKLSAIRREAKNQVFMQIVAEPAGFPTENDYNRAAAIYASMKASFQREVVAGAE